jgi:hypothetical protein
VLATRRPPPLRLLRPRFRTCHDLLISHLDRLRRTI